MIIALIVVTYIVCGILTVQWIMKDEKVESFNGRREAIGGLILWPGALIIAAIMRIFHWFDHRQRKDRGVIRRVSKVLDFTLGLK